MEPTKRIQFLEELLEDLFSEESIDSIPEENRWQAEVYQQYLKELIKDLKDEVQQKTT